MDLPKPRQRRWRSLVHALAGLAIVVQGLLASSPPRATATERSPEESLLSGHKIEFLHCLQLGQFEQPRVRNRAVAEGEPLEILQADQS